jgi:outer membrane protein assembly factor BamB
MTLAQTEKPTGRKPLRLWPGVALVILQWLAWLGLPLVAPEAGMYGALGALAGGLAIVVWWLFFSRAHWPERLGAPVLMIAALAATPLVLHESVATAGMGMLFYFYAIPVLCLAFVVWAVATRGLADGPRRVAMVATILLACGAWALLRTGGITGEGDSEFHWRWTKTPEERLLARAGGDPTVLASAPAEEAVPADWPGFRGLKRNGIVPGVRIATDWSTSPPIELWRRPIGPGWSSFAVAGDRLYTQEQRGEDEVASCYAVTTGEPVWKHRDGVRFWESNAGAGPRATPTLRDGRVYTMGATGILNALDAGDGAVVWSRDTSADTGKRVPTWGFSSSPLVVDDLVVVATAGVLIAYDLVSGDPRWVGPAGGSGYSSPQWATIDGVAQILLLSGAGVIGVSPADGALLWKYAWPGDGIVQPALTSDGDVLIGSGSGMGGEVGVRRIAVATGPRGWSVEERWSSRGLKPYFNDFVVHEGHAFGFDGGILSCIDLEDGHRAWKGGRYGHGQLVLLPDQDLLLVLSERGELALVGATPDGFKELARLPAIEGKTWNHPVVVGDVLLVRNGREMVAYRLALAG